MPLFANSDSILSIKSKYDVNFEIGALISYHINKFVEIRNITWLLFSNKSISYVLEMRHPRKIYPQVYF